MNTIFLLIVSCLISSQVLADNGSILRDPFGGVSIKATQINDESAFIAGLRGGWIMNNSYGVGGGFYFSPNDIDASTEASTGDKSHETSFIYGGLEAEYIGKWNKRIHYTIHSLIGIGRLSYGDNEYYFEPDPPYFKNVGGFSSGDNDDDDSSGSDGLFVFEPSINIEINVNSKIRLAAGISYRAVAGVELDDLENSDINGFGTSIVLKFGQYK
ncbi:hypothetical protein ACFL2X_07305 [Candidatus Latescibacterota bacterium]